MKRRQFLFTLPAIVSTSGIGSAHAVAAPIWASSTGFAIQQGKTYSLAALCADPSGLPLIFSPLSTLPFGVSLDKNTGALTVSSQTSTGSYGVRFRAFNGLVAADSAFLTMSVSAVAAPPPPAIQGPMVFTPSFSFAKDVFIGAGVFWNKYQVDKREGIIGWCDGDHSEPTKLVPKEEDANSVRYFNTRPTPYLGIPGGSSGYLVPPALTGKGAKITDYDNYHWWYAPSDDKFFWIFTAAAGTGGRSGIFDMATGKWSHGNSGINADAWPNGPYWSDYVTQKDASPITIVKNAPNGFSEAFDSAVAITGNRLFIIERNPNFPATSKAPRRIITPSIAGKPYAIKSDQHNQFMNSGVCVGEWFFFIRPATVSEQASYSDPRMREFWKVRLRAPYDQYERLADFPIFDIQPVQNMAPGRTNNPAWGPLLVHDEDSNSIICVYERLWVYDIDADTWTNQTPSKYQRVLSAVGGMIKSKREIIFRPGTNVDTEHSTLVNGHPARHSWSKIKITGGQKRRARWVPRVMNMTYPGSTAANPWGGKHTRYVYSDICRRVDGTVERGGYVWQFGGDYKGVPYTSAESVPGYPLRPGGWATDSGRQDQYRAPVAEVGGKVQIEMSCNHVAFYPYPGGPDPASTQKGPGHPDGVGVVFDKRGDAWIGPGYYRFQLETQPPSAGSLQLLMYRFRLPNKHTNGVRMGNGWAVPPQTKLRSAGETLEAGDFGVGDKTFFGGSNIWTAYDQKDDCVVMLVHASEAWKSYLYRFPCMPTNGKHSWTRQLLTRSTGEWSTFANTITRNGATADTRPGPKMTGAPAIVGDYLYAVQIFGAAAGDGADPFTAHKNSNVAYLLKQNLRTPSDYEYLPLPTHFSRGYDAPVITQTPPGATAPNSVNEIRDIQAMGHLVVLSPPAVHYQTNEPWLYWYNTNTRTWTAGQTWDQMRAGDASLPAFPGIMRGKMCCVPETGEVWYMTGDSQMGVVKYRIW